MTEQSAELTFSELIGETSEPNTPSGGIATIDWILTRAILPPRARVLEIGCATGFTPLEIAACRPDVTAYGIDMDAASLEAAEATARAHGLTNARFQQADARKIPFAEGTFDLVLAGNVPAFVKERSEMIRECARVVRPGGCLAAVPIYYVAPPPEEVRAAVEASIGAPIEVWSEDYWLTLYEDAGLVLRARDVHRFRDVPESEQEEYARWVMAAATNAGYPPERGAELERQLVRNYGLFNTNNRYAGYTVMLFRRPLLPPHRLLFGPA